MLLGKIASKVFVLKNSSSSDKASGYIPRSGAGVDNHGRVSRLYEQSASHFSGQASNGYETLKSICLFIYFPDRTILLQVSLWVPSRTHRMKDNIDFITKGCISFMFRNLCKAKVSSRTQAFYIQYIWIMYS